MGVAATYFDGHDAKGRPVDLRQDGGDLIAESDGEVLVRWPLADIRHADAPEARGGRLRVRLGHDDDARLTISDIEDSRRITAWFPNLARKPTTQGRVWKTIAIWGTAAAVSLFILFWFILPIVAVAVAGAIPRETEHRYGQRIVEKSAEVFALIGGKATDDPFCTSPVGQPALDGLAQRLTADLDDGIPLRIWVVRAPVVNALAFPGGHIVVFEGFIDFVENGDELAGVLAHEIGHAIDRHPTVLAVERAATAAFLGFFFGDITGGVALAAIGEAVINASYSRDMESAADAIAVELLQSAGIDASKLGNFLKRMVERQGEFPETLGFLSTHPASEDRIGSLPPPGKGYGPAMTSGDFRAVKNMCR